MLCEGFQQLMDVLVYKTTLCDDLMIFSRQIQL